MLFGFQIRIRKLLALSEICDLLLELVKSDLEEFDWSNVLSTNALEFKFLFQVFNLFLSFGKRGFLDVDFVKHFNSLGEMLCEVDIQLTYLFAVLFIKFANLGF